METMTDHPNAKDRLHDRPQYKDSLPEAVGAEHWSATAPVQGDQFGESGRIPLRLARLAWEAYAASGHRQEFGQVNRRAGFSWGEVVMLLRGPAHYRAAVHFSVCYKDCGKERNL